VPSRFDAAVKAVEQKPEARAPEASPTSSPPSAASAEASNLPSASGASTAAGGGDSFGEDPVDSPAPPQPDKLADFYKWLASCKSQSDLQKGLAEWQAYTKAQRVAGDVSFGTAGENAIKMREAYAKRKSEVPV